MKIMKKIEECGYRVGTGIGHLIARPLDWVMRMEVGEIPLVEEDVMKYAIQCFGGPKDGHTEVIERSVRPPYVYVWESRDDQQFTRAEGAAREALRSRLGTLAYRFHHSHAREGMPNSQEFVYTYDEEHNKSHAEKAANAPKE